MLRTILFKLDKAFSRNCGKYQTDEATNALIKTKPVDTICPKCVYNLYIVCVTFEFYLKAFIIIIYIKLIIMYCEQSLMFTWLPE